MEELKKHGDGSHVSLMDINRIKTREPSPCLHRGV